uniref:Uncharacterized protein n=1 Tax=Proboscia inermis TaxID=420281 RepID=A0A7S0GHA6_9STRA|mmetsp:Transcript_49166/g.49518  ORF Transcript_49166/g.49518 Transcript_49166/m.49518 type:complete len:220 (+) Transcript_49166:115-774(+)
MACCCLDGSPVSQEEVGKSKANQRYGDYIDNPNKFDVNMCHSCTKSPLCCCFGGLPIVSVCSAIKLRHKVLNHVNPGSGWENYTCCQSKFGGCCCIQPGSMGEQNFPAGYMACEACCCAGMAISATRIEMMEEHRLSVDACDNRIIRFNNCLQCAVCVARIVDCIINNDTTEYIENVLECIASIVFCSVSGCMTAQVDHEVNLRDKAKSVSPTTQGMER